MTTLKKPLFQCFLFVLSATECLASPAWTLNESLVLARITERLLIICSGVLLLFLGYKLFAKVVELGDLKAEVPRKFSFHMQRVGPGVFFALFGSSILLYSMTADLNITSTSGNDTGVNPQDPITSLSFGMPQPEGVTREQNLARLIFNIEKLKLYAASDITIKSDRIKSEISDASIAVTLVQQSLVDQLFGTGSYSEWKVYKQMLRLDPNSEAGMSDAQRKRVSTIDKVMRSGDI